MANLLRRRTKQANEAFMLRLKVSGKELIGIRAKSVRHMSKVNKLKVELLAQGITLKEFRMHSSHTCTHVNPQPKEISMIKQNLAILIQHGYEPKTSKSKDKRIGTRFENHWIHQGHRGKEDDLTCKQRRHARFGKKYLSKKTFKPSVGRKLKHAA